MPPHKKSSLEAFFSLKQHRRRFSKNAVRTPIEDFSALRERRVTGGPAAQTRGSHDNLDTHFDALKLEFSGQSALLLEHARLNVLLRRKIRPCETYQGLLDLWGQEKDFLLAHLNIRWMVSACDSVADWDPDPAARASALSVSLLVNTVEIAETERYLEHNPERHFDPDRVSQIKTELIPLFEGLSGFTIGTDDTLRNMRCRIAKQKKSHFTEAILSEVFQRFQEHDTVYARLRVHHHRSRTRWW